MREIDNDWYPYRIIRVGDRRELTHIPTLTKIGNHLRNGCEHQFTRTMNSVYRREGREAAEEYAMSKLVRV